MFKLIKLAGYALFGYACYEFIAGMYYGNNQRKTAEQSKSSESAAAARSRGHGAVERTEERSGMSTSHIVGRGAMA